MEIIESNLPSENFLHKSILNLYKDLNFVILDIETTGLNSRYHKVILIGLLYCKNGQLTLKQFFASTQKEEEEILLHFHKAIQNFDCYITYNGDRFDLPFLNKRFNHYNLPCLLNKHMSIDFLKLIKKIQPSLALEDCKLKSLETHLGIHRIDTITGKDSVLLYKVFEKNQSPAFKNTILLHNHDDLLYFFKVLATLNTLSKNELLKLYPYIFSIKGTYFYLTEKKIHKNHLVLEGFYNDPTLVDYKGYEDAYTFEYTHSNRVLTIQIPLYKGIRKDSSKCSYLDLNDFPFFYKKINDYSFLPENIMIIQTHSSLDIEEICCFSTALISHIIQDHFDQ